MKKSLFQPIKTKLEAYSKYIFIVLSLFLIVSLIRNIIRISEAGGRIGKAEERVEKLRRESEELQRKLEAVETETFIEKQSRENLGLAKEGEIVIILPDDETLRRLAPRIEEEEEILPDPTWKMWLKLFY